MTSIEFSNVEFYKCSFISLDECQIYCTQEKFDLVDHFQVRYLWLNLIIKEIKF